MRVLVASTGGAGHFGPNDWMADRTSHPRLSLLGVVKNSRAALFLGIWFVMQVYFGGLGVAHPTGGEGVAFFAHVGGFVFGFLFVRAFAVRRPLRPAW